MERIEEFCNSWNDFLCLLIGQSPINGLLFRDLIRDTFKFLSEFEEKEYLPREIVHLAGLMGEVSAYALMGNGKEGYDYILIHCVVECLRYQFGNGFNMAGSKYPVLLLGEDVTMDRIDVEGEDLFNLEFIVGDLPF